MSEVFHSTIRAEGPSQSLRSKFPTGVIRALKGEDGDVLEYEVVGKFVTGIKVLKGKAAELAKTKARFQSREDMRGPKKAAAPKPAPAPAKKATPKPTPKQAPAPVKKANPVRKPAPKAPVRPSAANAPKVAQTAATKSNKRKTNVAYQAPKVPVKSGSKPTRPTR